MVSSDSRRESQGAIRRTRRPGAGRSLAKTQDDRATYLEDLAVSLEHLLLWLSAKGQGSWSQFRAAVEQLYAGQDHEPLVDYDDGEHHATRSGLPVYQQVRSALERLGHVEFFPSVGPDWRVVPPTVVWFPESNPGIGSRSWRREQAVTREGLLCGARSPSLLRRLKDEFHVDRTTAPGTPDRIVVRGCTEAVVRLGLLVQEDAPMAMLSVLPGVRELAMRSPANIPENPGWEVHRFSVSRLRWVESSGDTGRKSQIGLFRFVMGHKRMHYLRWRGSSYQVRVEVGKYAIVPSKRRILTYDPERITLSVPAVCRPPLLIERALILCSGLLPRFNLQSRRLEYTRVRHETMGLASQLLRQEVAR